MKRKGKIPGRYHKTLKEQVRENPRLAAVYVILRVLVVLALVAQVFNGNFENVFLCVLTLILFTIPSFIERTIRIDIPDTLEIIILLFIFAAEILGEIQAYYVQFPYWDTMLHTLNGFLCAAIGFSLLDILNRDERLAFKLSPVYLAVVAFCFSMTIGVLWEFFECFMDQMFLLDMQKDTIVHSIGSVMLDPAGGNTPVAIHDITDVIVITADGAPAPTGPGRLSGYRHPGHHERPLRQLYRRGGVLLYRLFLCKEPRQGLVRQAFHPQGPSGVRRQKITEYSALRGAY